MKQIRSVGIHDGAFHADEVTACALLVVTGQVDSDKIIRTRDLNKLQMCEYICDVGGVYDPAQKQFDHHQASYKGDLSSAGMILHYLRDNNLLSGEEFELLNQGLVLGVDAHDNGKTLQEKGWCTFSHIIANFNPPAYEITAEESQQAFEQAHRFACGHIQRLLERLRYNKSCRALVEAQMQLGRAYLLFEQAIPWIESFFSLGGDTHPALFVVMPAGNHWKLRAIPPNYEQRMQVRLPLPERWAGLLDADLKQASGIEGAIFCHKGRFTSVWETKQAALQALQQILQQVGMRDEELI